MWPAEVLEGVGGDALGRFGHQASPLEVGVEPEAALIAACAIVRPQVDAADQLVAGRFEGDRPVELRATRHLAEALLDVMGRAIARVGPGDMSR
ncbi:MAG TPA: hypothetical protein VE963_13275 [Reyranella sp.]|nr:hypothetical protein [Reyranella sp.]